VGKVIDKLEAGAEAEERRIPRVAETTVLTALCELEQGGSSRFDWL